MFECIIIKRCDWYSVAGKPHKFNDNFKEKVVKKYFFEIYRVYTPDILKSPKSSRALRHGLLRVIFWKTSKYYLTYRSKIIEGTYCQHRLRMEYKSERCCIVKYILATSLLYGWKCNVIISSDLFHGFVFRRFSSHSRRPTKANFDIWRDIVKQVNSSFISCRIY